jgi:hypothetical protein
VEFNSVLEGEKGKRKREKGKGQRAKGKGQREEGPLSLFL